MVKLSGDKAKIRRPQKRDPKAAGRAPTESDIRERAYQLFLARGGEPGRELEDWLQAERELKGA